MQDANTRYENHSNVCPSCGLVDADKAKGTGVTRCELGQALVRGAEHERNLRAARG